MLFNENDVWFLDSECNNQMTRNRELFTSLDSFVQFEVNLGDGNKVIVNGKGVITVHAKNDKKKIVEYFNIWQQVQQKYVSSMIVLWKGISGR